MPARRPSPAALLVALVLALLAPVGVVMATGLAHGGAGDDGEVETADGRDPDGARHRPGRADHGRRGPEHDRHGPVRDRAPLDRAGHHRPAGTRHHRPAHHDRRAAAADDRRPAADDGAAAPAARGAADQVVALANEARAQAGCGPLRVDARITAAAQAHSDDMAANGYFSHDSLDGRSFADRLRAAGYPSPGGENIAQGQRNAQSVHQAWMNSSGHRANILNCGFTTIGVGVNQTAWTWTQDFGY